MYSYIIIVFYVLYIVTVWLVIFGGIFVTIRKKAPELIFVVITFVTAARLATPTENL